MTVRPGSSAGAVRPCEASGVAAQQLQRLYPDCLRKPFDRPERQVALAPFQTAEVGAVDAEDVGEGLLGQATVVPVATEGLADGPLQIAFHDVKRRCRGATCRSTDL